ncbi:MAG: PDZ domain-containing protein, partial [Verrucomicrobia bacterium]|nr:PDZ domain-containing protein [Verrucomicrobiota bacterium]
FREGSFTAPAIDRNGKLAGLMMRYDSRSQTLELVAGPVIAHFLHDFDAHPQGKYQGFPRGGLDYASLRDPQLRHYAKLPGGSSDGVYITDVADAGPAAVAGIRAGDVLTEVAGQAIDQDGNFADPLYGRINLSHLLTKAFVGDKLPVKILRDGQAQSLQLTLSHKAPEDYVIPPYVLDAGPRYLIAGGLIFQELSRQYLKEWGGDWQKQAPQRLVYLDRYQSALVQDGRRRVVILSNVLPTASNVGYEDLNYLVVKAINGHSLGSLDDLAKALAEKPEDGFYRVEFEDFPREIFLDSAHLSEEDAKIQRTYGLPELQRLN